MILNDCDKFNIHDMYLQKVREKTLLPFDEERRYINNIELYLGIAVVRIF